MNINFLIFDSTEESAQSHDIDIHKVIASHPVTTSSSNHPETDQSFWCDFKPERHEPVKKTLDSILSVISETFGLNYNQLAQCLQVSRQAIYDWRKSNFELEKLPEKRKARIKQMLEFSEMVVDKASFVTDVQTSTDGLLLFNYLREIPLDVERINKLILKIQPSLHSHTTETNTVSKTASMRVNGIVSILTSMDPTNRERSTQVIDSITDFISESHENPQDVTHLWNELSQHFDMIDFRVLKSIMSFTPSDFPRQSVPAFQNLQRQFRQSILDCKDWTDTQKVKLIKLYEL